MKSLITIVLLTVSFSSCIVDLDIGEPFIDIRNTNEYETKEVIKEIWSRGVLVYEESVYHAWLDLDFQNSGGIRAKNVSAEIVFYKHSRELQRITIYLPDINAGDSYVYSLDTGFESIYDYSDYEVSIYWD